MGRGKQGDICQVPNGKFCGKVGWKKEGAGGVGEGSGGGGARPGFWVARKGRIYRDARRSPRPWAEGLGKQSAGSFPARFAPGGPGGPTKLGSHRLRPGRAGTHRFPEGDPTGASGPGRGSFFCLPAAALGPGRVRFLLSSSSGAEPWVLSFVFQLVALGPGREGGGDFLFRPRVHFRPGPAAPGGKAIVLFR